MSSVIDKLGVFVDSYDGMEDVWPYYFRLFDKYWPNCKLHRYLVVNKKEFYHPNLILLKTGEDRNWFNMTYKALSMVKETFVFFMIEDDFMSKFADEQVLEEILDYMESEDLFFYRFTCPYNFPKNRGNLLVHGDVIYPISIQPAIWRVDKLMFFLKELQKNGCKSPWDFERYFIELYKNYSKDDVIYGIRYDSRNLFGFTNGIIQGKWDPRVVRFYKRQGILINTKPRGLMPTKKVLLDHIKRNRIIRSLSFERQEKLKKLLKRFGLNFIT